MYLMQFIAVDFVIYSRIHFNLLLLNSLLLCIPDRKLGYYRI